MTPFAAILFTLKIFLKIHGNEEAIIPPKPIIRPCIIKPLFTWLSGSLSTTKALKGSILTLPKTSSTQSKPAAIHNALLCGIMSNAIELKIAPNKK